jgi:hypothetical protein
VIKALSLVAQKHRLCVTRKGFFGLGPQKTKPGDTICLIPDMTCPATLRPERPLYYSIIGGAFVVDIMSGEALDFPDFEIKTLTII